MSYTFRAMNTDVMVEGTDREIRPWFERVEATLSRFNPESPLSQLNRLQGRWVIVPGLLYRAVGAALESARLTAGAFDPTVLDALEGAGYVRSFDLGQSAPARNATAAGRWREVRLAPTAPAVRLPTGVRLDLGGIGKGLAVDGAMERLAQEPRALVNAGGDVALRTAPGDAPVLVDVEDPWDPQRTLATFSLKDGAAATSSAIGRCWGPGLHHIIDPATGRPAETDVATATVFAPTVAWAEVLAKAAIVLGSERALALWRHHRCRGLMLLRTGQQILSEDLEDYRHVSA